MKLNALLGILAITVAATSALKIPLKQAKRASVSVSKPGTALANVKALVVTSNTTGSGFDVDSVHDLIYLANITVGGNRYPVQLDTGSSDLWIQGSVTPLPNANPTSQTYNLSYGIGWAFGHVSYAPVQFAGISVPSQAFMDVSSAQNPALSYGADGILGLGFTSLSVIDYLVNNTGSPTGRSLLYNLFLDNPKEPNFIAYSLSRSTDPNDTADGLFTIGEYDPQYKDVANSVPIPTWPVNSPSRWSILVDSIIVGNKQIPVTTSVASAPVNKAVALLDSGTSYSYAPPEVCEAIYGGVEGAQYDEEGGVWNLPCSAEIDMAIQINNVVYPLDPLDVSPLNPSNPKMCMGSFLPQAVTVGQGQFDWLVGDNFLRSVYSVYDFGDFDSSGRMGNPYMKLLALVNPDQASVAFHNVRGGAPLNNITYNAENSTTSTTTISLSQDVAQVLDKIGTYFPALLAVIALNSLLLLVLIIAGVTYLWRRTPKTARKQRGRMSPVPLNHTNSRFSGGAQSQHVYEPVSMALTEDTFVPPMPAFSMGKSRPKSSFSNMSGAGSPISASYPEDEPFTPPTPSFNSNVQPGDRPQSFVASSSHARQSFMPPERPVSSYVPSASSANTSPFSPPPAFVTSPPHEADETPTPSAPVAPASNSLGVPRSPSFKSNVQPGDRPRSYETPDDNLHTTPAPAFSSGDRPRSMAYIG